MATGGLVGGPSSPLSAGIPYEAGKERSFYHGVISQAFAAAKAEFRKLARSFSAGAPGGGAPAANAALAHRLYSALLTPASWAAWNYVAMRESGWSNIARNPSSGAYGIAQALPPTKYPFAGQAAGGSNPAAQIGWMWNYMGQRYGGPLGAAAHERAFNWYERGSWQVPITGPAMVHRGEMILPDRIAAAVRGAAARGGDGGQFTGRLYLDSGQFMGVVKGEITEHERQVTRRAAAGTGQVR
jgi:hypothetical protein